METLVDQDQAQILFQSSQTQAGAEDLHGLFQLLDGRQAGGDADHGIVGVHAVGISSACIGHDDACTLAQLQHKDKNAKLIEVVDEITPEIIAMAGGKGSSLGTGGMATKIRAAKIAMSHGIDMLIINGDKPTNLYDVFDGVKIGTLFEATKG